MLTVSVNIDGLSAGTYGGTITVSATGATNPPQVVSLSLTVNQAPAITSGNATTFTAGQEDLFTVTATGFPTPALGEVAALPDGVSFNDNGDAGRDAGCGLRRHL